MATTSLLDMYSKMANEAKTSNLARQKAVEAIFDEVISRYRPGGSFGQSYLKQLERQKVQDVSGAQQSDISSGLYGLRNRGNEWESTIGSSSRLKLEDLLMERLSTAQLGKASFLQSIENPYPDYNLLTQAYSSAARTPTTTRTVDRGQPLQDWMNSNLAVPSFGGGTTSTPASQSLASQQATRQATENNWWAKQKELYGNTGGNTQTYSNLLGNFNPEQANMTTGNIPGSTATMTQPSMSATEAMKKFGTYSEFANWAKGQGLNPGSEEEWNAVKKRVG